MGTVNDKNKTTLSPELYNDIMTVFRKIDIDGSKSIDKQETLKYWKGNFSKINTDELFRAVDTDDSGDITEDEWVAFWEDVKKSGYSDQAIRDEIESLLAGEAWVSFETRQKKKKKSYKNN